MPKHTESQTVTAILKYLQLRGIPAWRMNTGAFRSEYKGRVRFHRFGTPGMADILGIMNWGVDPGTFFAIEVKSERGRESPAQQAFREVVTKAGGIAFVARSVDDVREGLWLS